MRFFTAVAGGIFSGGFELARAAGNAGGVYDNCRYRFDGMGDAAQSRDGIDSAGIDFDRFDSVDNFRCNLIIEYPEACGRHYGDPAQFFQYQSGPPCPGHYCCLAVWVFY